MKEIFKIAVSLENSIQYQLLERFNLKKTLRILSWVQRFTINCNIKERKKRSKGPRTTKEIDLQLIKMILDKQSRSELDSAFNEIEEALNLKKNKQGLYKCCGRIIGEYPIFVPRKTLLVEKMVENAHYQTLHGGVNLTITEIRRSYWIPKLRHLTKRIIQTLNGCRRFHATAYVAPIPGQLPPDRTNGRRSFQVIGLDFAGPITYEGKKDSLKQAYVFLITCSLSRAAHIELVGSQKIEEFIREFKRFVARRGKRTRRTYSRMELECLLLFVANRRSVSEIQGTFKNFQGQSPFQMV